MVGVSLDYKAVLAASGVALLVIYFSKSAIKQALPVVAESVNPVSQDNIFFRGFNSVYSAVTGSEDTPGEDIADLTAGWFNN